MVPSTSAGAGKKKITFDINEVQIFDLFMLPAVKRWYRTV
jgi:hypothetical protein